MKKLIFDMDGTIADLYGVNDWLLKLRAEDATPYKEAKPLYNMEILNTVLDILKDKGYKISVVSWLAKESTPEYDKKVRKEKLEWLERYNFPYDEIHLVKYGTPKQGFTEMGLNILIDDSEEVRAAFTNRAQANKRKKVINAKTENVISALINLLVGE